MKRFFHSYGSCKYVTFINVRYLAIILCFCAIQSVYSQDTAELFLPDDKYLEDQFYLGATFNIIFEMPEGVSQQNLSYGLIGGFIKDIPVNKARNIGFGIGLGYAINSYYTNLLATKTDGGIEYSIIGSEVSYKRNKIETHTLEVPIEFRWRTSDNVSHKFWRIYTGVKLGYVFSGRSKFVADSGKISFTNDDIREFQYGLMLSFGYNTFNIHAYYGLQDLFKDGTTTIDGDPLGFVPLHIGLIFYIL